MNPEVERWLPVVGYEGFYDVSDQGRARSVERTVWRTGARYKQPHQITYPGRLMATSLQKHGYVGVILYRGNRSKSLRVHQLVLTAFVGPCPVGMETLHDNGRRDDNRLSNLRWGTHTENYADQVRHGTASRGDGEGNCSRGHSMTGPNARPAMTRRGSRGCLACARALNSWYWFNSRNPGHDRESWIQDRADANYRSLTDDAA